MDKIYFVLHQIIPSVHIELLESSILIADDVPNKVKKSFGRNDVFLDIICFCSLDHFSKSCIASSFKPPSV